MNSWVIKRHCVILSSDYSQTLLHTMSLVAQNISGIVRCEVWCIKRKVKTVEAVTVCSNEESDVLRGFSLTELKLGPECHFHQEYNILLMKITFLPPYYGE